MLGEINQAQRTDTVSIHLSEVPEEASVEAGGSESPGAGQRRGQSPGAGAELVLGMVNMLQRSDDCTAG